MALSARGGVCLSLGGLAADFVRLLSQRGAVSLVSQLVLSVWFRSGALSGAVTDAEIFEAKSNLVQVYLGKVDELAESIAQCRLEGAAEYAEALHAGVYHVKQVTTRPSCRGRGTAKPPPHQAPWGVHALHATIGCAKCCEM
jgi:hypothetical protein